MTLDVAMGGSTNTVLHLLAAAQEAGIDFTMSDIDEVSRRVPCICKVAPNGHYVMEDVHRAGGIPAILGELHRGGLLHDDVASVHAPDLQGWLDEWDIRGGSASDEAIELFHAAPGCVRSAEAFSQSERWDTLDVDAAERLHPRRRARLHARRRPRDPVRQHRRRRLRREDRGRRRVDLEVLRPGRRGRVAGGRGRRDPGRPRQARRRRGDPLRGPARRARACRRCCTRPPT